LPHRLWPQMPSPHLLALASTLTLPSAGGGGTDGGRVLVVGDHRQLGTILKHPFASDARACLLRHRPDLSAYGLVKAMHGEAPAAPWAGWAVLVQDG
jgi:hypothetical protein